MAGIDARSDGREGQFAEHDASRDAVEAVMKALENPRYKWRTIRGVAEESGVPPEIVLGITNRYREKIVKSSVPSKAGEDLYTTREHFRSVGSVGEKILGAFRNRIQ